MVDVPSVSMQMVSASWLRDYSFLFKLLVDSFFAPSTPCLLAYPPFCALPSTQNWRAKEVRGGGHM